MVGKGLRSVKLSSCNTTTIKYAAHVWRAPLTQLPPTKHTHLGHATMPITTQNLVTAENVDGFPKDQIMMKESHEHEKLVLNYAALREEMERCIRALGVSEKNLREQQDTIRTISEKVNLFLQAFWKIVPKNFSKAFKSPCWNDCETNIICCTCPTSC